MARQRGAATISGVTRGFRWAGWSLLAMSIVFGAMTCGNAANLAGAWIGGETVEGTVVEHRARTFTHRNHTRSSQHAVVRFQAPDGRMLTMEDQVGRGSSPYPVGSTVRVRFDPDAPEEAIIAGSSAALGFGVVFGVVMVALMFVTSLILLVLARPPWRVADV